MSYSFHWNPHFKRKRKAGLQRAQRAIDSSVLRFSEPFLPFQSGVLRNSGITGTVVGSGRVQWTAPYAHYLYEGRVMGPNVPLHEGGQLVGFFSPKAPKKYTGKKLQFHGAPKRGARWFDRMKRVHMITGLATSLMTMDKAMLMAKASTGLAFVAFGLLFSLLMQAAGVWDSMSDAEKVVTILGAVTAAAFAAALAVGAFQSALSLGVAVVAITAGIAAMMMAINSAEKRVNQMNAATQQSLSPSTYGGVSGRSASIPALATGAVIPPNGEFLAVLGDQKKGRNLEAPENLIRQIVREESGGGLSGTLTIRPAPGLTRYLAYELKREDARAGTPLVEGTRR